MSHSRVLPLSTYHDPNYDSDTSFENYYLNYEEEKNSAPVSDYTNQALHNDDDDDDDHDVEMMISESRKACDDHHHDHVIRRVRSANPRRKRARLGSMIITTPDNSSQSTITASTATNNYYDDDDDPTVKNERAVGSSSSLLFIKRVLQKADMNEQQHRLSLPCKQVVIDPDRFFTRDESTRLRNRLPVPARLVDPRGREYGINLRLTKSGPTTLCYAIGKPWLRIKDENGFEPGMILDVRVNRRSDGELCFTLHIVR